MRRAICSIKVAALCTVGLLPAYSWAGNDLALEGAAGCQNEYGSCDCLTEVAEKVAAPDDICREVLPVQSVNIPVTVDPNPDGSRISFTGGPAPFTVQVPNDKIPPRTAGTDTQFIVMNVNAQEVIATGGFSTVWEGPVLGRPRHTFQGNASLLLTLDYDYDRFPTGYLYSVGLSAYYYITRYYCDAKGVTQACPRVLVAVGTGGAEFYRSQ